MTVWLYRNLMLLLLMMMIIIVIIAVIIIRWMFGVKLKD